MPARFPTALLAVLVVLAAGAPPARGETGDRNKPINYSADSGDVNYQTKVGNLSGNVVITQGTMTIKADRIVFRQNADNSISATAHGNPITFRQKRDGVDEYFEGYAQRAEYDGQKDLLELFDRALLKRGQDEIRSNYISYNTKSELFRAEGRPDAPAAAADTGPGSRVRGVIQPKGDFGGLGAKDGDKAKGGDKAKDGEKTKDGDRGASDAVKAGAADKPAGSDKAARKGAPPAPGPAEPLPLQRSGELAPKAGS